MIKTFERNTNGRDFVVGDIHGCFTQLSASLAEKGFDELRDRLFAVGDLVDRGPESDQVVDWLSKPWFHSVRGNHDEFVIEFIEGPIDKGIYLLNGGGWFLDMHDSVRQYYYNEIKKLPLAIEVDTPNGKVGIVHADVAGDDWDDFKERIEDYKLLALWGRMRIRGMYGKENIKNVHRVYVGHTVVPHVHDIGNVRYIDLGVCFEDGAKEFYLEQIN